MSAQHADPYSEQPERTERPEVGLPTSKTVSSDRSGAVGGRSTSGLFAFCRTPGVTKGLNGPRGAEHRHPDTYADRRTEVDAPSVELVWNLGEDNPGKGATHPSRALGSVTLFIPTGRRTVGLLTFGEVAP